jgi:hypothetical protein
MFGHGFWGSLPCGSLFFAAPAARPEVASPVRHPAKPAAAKQH